MVDRTLLSSDFEVERERELTPEERVEQKALLEEATAGLEALHRLEQQDGWRVFQALMNERVAVTVERLIAPAEPHIQAHLAGQLAAYKFVATWFADQAAEFKRTLTANGNAP